MGTNGGVESKGERFSQVYVANVAGLQPDNLESTPLPCRLGGGVARYRIMETCVGPPNNSPTPAPLYR